MSDKEVKKDKVMTKYDKKIQRREEAKAKEKKQRLTTNGIMVLMVLAVVAFIASFPIRSYLSRNEAFVTINGEEIKQVEFDYNYGNVVNDYISQYGSTYLGLMGLNVAQDFSTQMYNEDMTWKDFFQKMTVENMMNTKALRAEADAAGFEFDTTSEVEEFKAAMDEAAKAAGITTKAYVQQVYGPYATVDELSAFVAENARVNAYFQEISAGMNPNEDEINAYYEEHKVNFDSVDYYVASFPVQLTSEAPTDEEITKALEDAKKLAEAAEADLGKEGEEKIGVAYYATESALCDWLFDDARKKGDTTVIVDATSNTCYAAEFTKRYRDETPTANVRVIITQEDNGQAILDEWKAGAATEESFADLCKTYTIDSSAIATGGLIEGVAASGISGELSDWIFAENRAVGDTTSMMLEGGTTYVLYYVGEGAPEWKTNIEYVLLSQKQTEYITALTETVTVEDTNGNLNYLKIEEEAEVPSGEATTTEGEVTIEGGTATESSATTE